jgi:hypothetical protein
MTKPGPNIADEGRQAFHTKTSRKKMAGIRGPAQSGGFCNQSITSEIIGILRRNPHTFANETTIRASVMSGTFGKCAGAPYAARKS